MRLNNMAYQLVQAKPISYGGTRALFSVKYIVLHYTAGNGDTAMAECRYFANGNTRAAGAHFFVGQAGDVVQSIPINRTAWSVGGNPWSGTSHPYYGKCTNFNSVSIEMCDQLNKDASVTQKNAVKTLISYIQGQCPNAKTIIRHYDVTGKPCPARYLDDKKWTDLRNYVTAKKKEEPTKIKETTMQCLFKIKGGNGTVYYFDGQTIKSLNNIDQMKIIQRIYKDNNGHDIPYYTDWGKSNPWYQRLSQVCERKNVKL